MRYSVYDKELNEYRHNYIQNEIELCDYVKNLIENESNRLQFYEFDDENGKKYDCWTLDCKFNLKLITL